MNEDDLTILDDTAREAVELANRCADDNPEADLRDIADGLLAGAVHYWLYSRQPCGDPLCEECGPLSTPEGRIAALKREIIQAAEESDYYDSPDDLLAGRA